MAIPEQTYKRKKILEQILAPFLQWTNMVESYNNFEDLAYDYIEHQKEEHLTIEEYLNKYWDSISDDIVWKE